jgi:sigma-E factor negative regulatory protein RseC
MAIEKGVVYKTGTADPPTAWVKVVPASDCGSCSARDHCNPGAETKAREVEALNPVGAKVGDRIQLTVATGALLKITFLLYLLPVLCMFVGALGGYAAAPRMGMDPTAVGAGASLFTLAVALVLVRSRVSRLAAQEAYRPRIARIIGREMPDSTLAEACPYATPESLRN